MGRKIKKPYLVENLEITDAVKDGKGVGRDNGVVIFVKDAVPGDVVDAWVYRKEKKHLIANTQKIVTPSPDRVEPECDHFQECGGCKFQTLSYEGQLKFKDNMVKAALTRIGGLEVEEWLPILGSEKTLWYRNKTEFSFSCKPWIPQSMVDSGDEVGETDVLGYHVPVYFDKILNVDKCHLHKPIVNAIRNELRAYSREHKISYHDHRAHQGFLRNIVFRTSDDSGEVMIVLIVNENKPKLVEEIFVHLEAKFPEITSFAWIHNDRLNSSYTGLETTVWKGTPHITEALGKWKYRIQPTSFFQTNPSQAHRLYEEVRKMIGDKVNLIYDLYCGAGSIGIYVSDHADRIVGIEYVDSAIADAKENLSINELDPARFSFYAGNIKEILDEELIAKEGVPEVVITDPPRNGMDKPVVEQLMKLKAPKIIYVSCNPATQARDIEILKELYDVKQVMPVDMFPQTGHVENIALLELKG